MTEIYSLGQVARMLDLQNHRIAYALITRALPEPEQRHARQRCFTPDDVQRIAEHFKVANPLNAVGIEKMEDK
jgi:DNA-binding transcriptional MerR regulator